MHFLLELLEMETFVLRLPSLPATETQEGKQERFSLGLCVKTL